MCVCIYICIHICLYDICYMILICGNCLKKNMAPTRVRVPQETVLAPNKPQTIYPTNHTTLRAQSLEISLEKWSPTNPTTSKLSLKHTEAHRSAPSLQ